jgi:hypothetical protein
VFVDDERHLVLVRKAPGKEKGLVMVNGSKIQVDVEEIPEQELKALRKKERVKPPRIPLDQPPVVGVVRRRKAEWGDGDDGESQGKGKAGSKDPTGSDGGPVGSTLSSWASAPKISSPLSRFWTYAVDQATTSTQQAVAAITPAGAGGSSLPSATKMPMQYALEALAWTQEFHSSSNFLSSSPADGWTLVSDKGVSVYRKLIPEASAIIPVHKGQKVVEGVSGEELAAIIQEDECRKVWDERFDSIRTLESFGHSCKTMFLTAKGGFPFRDRGFYVATVTARTQVPPAQALSRRSTGEVAEQTGSGAKNAIFVVAASFASDSATALFSSDKHNPYVLPIGRIYVDAWILETLDPYTKENYTIPSTRCTRLVAVDYAGAIPAAVNSMINASLPREILTLESYWKTLNASLPGTRLPSPCVVVAEKKGEDRLASVSWKLRKRDESRVLLEESFAGAALEGGAMGSKVYKAKVFVTLVKQGNGDGKPGPLSVERTPKPPAKRVLSASPRPEGRERTISEHTILGSSVSGPVSPSIASTSAAMSPSATVTTPPEENSLSTSSSVETLRSVRSQDAPLNKMPGTMVLSPKHTPSPKASGTLSPSTSEPTPITRQRSVSSSDVLAGSSSFNHLQYASSYDPSTSMFRKSPVLQALGNGATAANSLGGHVGRGRTMSSAFTPKGEVKPIMDLVVGEVVVDTRMYPDGYQIVVRSRMVDRSLEEGRQGGDVPGWVEVNAKNKGRDGEGEMYLKLGSDMGGKLPSLTITGAVTPASVTPSTSTSSTTSSASTLASGPSTTSAKNDEGSAEGKDQFLPLAYSIYTMPASPMHSSSLNTEAGATRHLLRLSLPTAQYKVSTVLDPLTGETRKPPEKPSWLRALEAVDESEDVGEVESEVEGDDAEAKAERVITPKSGRLRGAVIDIQVFPLARVDDDKSKERKKKRLKKVEVNGVEVPVVGEKESLTGLGREELLDDRVSKMPVLLRCVCLPHVSFITNSYIVFGQ